MSLGIMLDVALGLAMIFVILSTIASAIQEIIASVLSTRGKVLLGMLRQILDHQPAAAPAGQDTAVTLSDRVFGHPLIGALATVNLPGWLSRWTSSVKLPSYIPAGNFATALVETLREGHDQSLAVASQVERAITLLPDGSPVKRTLQAFIVEAKGDLDTFRTRLQTWYDDAMDRAAGVYKRYTQYMLLLIGLILAVAVNIDVLKMADTLWRDKGARELVTNAATIYLAAHEPRPTPVAQGDAKPDAVAPDVSAMTKQIGDAASVLSNLPLPIGWTNWPHVTTWQQVPFAVLRKLLGWLLTAFAVSLGAPFWFDMLQNIANLRGAGPKPDRGQPAPGGAA